MGKKVLTSVGNIRVRVISGEGIVSGVGEGISGVGESWCKNQRGVWGSSPQKPPPEALPPKAPAAPQKPPPEALSPKAPAGGCSTCFRDFGRQLIQSVFYCFSMYYHSEKTHVPIRVKFQFIVHIMLK